MNDFPIYQVPYLGNGMTIGLNAIIHVVISHGLAIGAFALLAFSEYYGFKHKSIHWEKFAKDFIRPLIIVITGVGAVTGVGIWFTISALAPRGTGSMLRIFFWPWFMEWAAFTSEVIIILIYYFLWDKWTEKKKRTHINLGIAYVIVAMISGFLITGILGFMLTPDGWVWDKNFFSAFFNPSFIPQLLLRFGFAFFLGSAFTISYLIFTKRDKDFKSEALRKFGLVSVVSLIVMGLSAFWYFTVVPSTFKTHSIFAVLTSHFSQFTFGFWLINIIALALLIAFAVTAFNGNINFSKSLAIPALIFAILFAAEFERIREFIRGPYLMPGYMYANQTLLEEEPLLNKEGSLQQSIFYKNVIDSTNVDNEGLYLFGKNCSVCHTIGGLNNILSRVKDRSRDGIFVMIGNNQRMVPFMSPFSGSVEERRILSEFIFRAANNKIKMDPPTTFLNEKIEIVKGGR